MSIKGLAYAFDREGLTPHQKLLLILIGDGADTEGCYPIASLPTLRLQAGMTEPDFDTALSALAAGESAYRAVNRLDQPCWCLPALADHHPACATEDDE